MNDESSDLKEGVSQEPGGSPREPKRIWRWNERKEYGKRAEKKNDFWIGFGLWFGGNVALFILSLPLYFLLGLLLSAVSQQGSGADWVFFLPSLLVLLVNVIALIYFAFTRRFIALGMLAAFGLVLLLSLLASLLFAGVCFLLTNSGSA